MFFQRSTNERHFKLGDVLRNGAAWEEPVAVMVAKASKNKFKPKRIGCKAAKAAERLANAGDVLNEDESTTLRALAARANYLAMDRPECAFATEELC